MTKTVDVRYDKIEEEGEEKEEDKWSSLPPHKDSPFRFLSISEILFLPSLFP